MYYFCIANPIFRSPMDNSKYIERLEKRGIKPTANRILVLEAMLAASRAVSLGEWEVLIRGTFLEGLTLAIRN